MNRQELIKKAIGAVSTPTFNGGVLNPEQQMKFETIINRSATVLPLVRKEDMMTFSKEIPRLYISEPITRGAVENTAYNQPRRPVSDKLVLNAQKLVSEFDLTFDSLLYQVEGDQFEETLVQLMSERVGVDLEQLGIQGNTGLAGGTDSESLLLSVLNGWSIQGNGSHQVDAGGQTINKNIFAEAMRSMPEVYRNRDMVWIASDIIVQDWVNQLAERPTPIGDAALADMAIVGPFGKPLISAPMIPSTSALSLTTGLPAELYGFLYGPFEFTSGVNDTLILNINGLGNRNIVFGSGTFQTVSVVSLINAVLSAAGDPAVASDDGLGRIIIRTTAVGAAQSITVVAGSTAAAVLGVQGAGLPNVVAGVNAGTAGNLREGSEIWLTSLKNLIWGMLKETRFHVQYQPRPDRFEFTIYNYVDFKIENLDAFVKIKNIRKQSL